MSQTADGDADGLGDVIDGWGDMSEVEREEALEEHRRSLKETVEAEFQADSEAAENALETLRESGDEQVETHTVTLTGDVEVEVVDSVPGHLEQAAAAANDGDAEAGVESMIDVLCHVIQTDGFDSRAVWQQYRLEYGTAFLAECAMNATEPYFDRTRELEDARRFRGER